MHYPDVLVVSAAVCSGDKAKATDLRFDVGGRLQVVDGARGPSHHRVVGKLVKPGHEVARRYRGDGGRADILEGERRRSLSRHWSRNCDEGGSEDCWTQLCHLEDSRHERSGSTAKCNFRQPLTSKGWNGPSRPRDSDRDRIDPAVKAVADSFTEHLSQVEESIYQIRNQSGQDPRNVPFKDLQRSLGELKVETERLAKMIRRDRTKLNAELKRVGLKEVSSAVSTICPAHP
jgi:hypothetical protein